MHRHEISFSVFEASVFYQWQAHCVPRDGMRKENCVAARRGTAHQFHRTGSQDARFHGGWSAILAPPSRQLLEVRTTTRAGETPAAAGKMQALHSRRGFDLGRLTRQTMRWMLIPPVSILETRSTR